MRLKLLSIPVALLLLLVTYHLASGFMTAKAIAAPNASMKSIAAAMLHPPYQMATPHRTLVSGMRFAIIPSVSACGTGSPPCTGETAKPTCQGCSPGYCYCPGCQTSGCTPYACTYVGGNRFCVYRNISSLYFQQHGDCNCISCEEDYNSSCTSGTCPPGPPCQ